MPVIIAAFWGGIGRTFCHAQPLVGSLPQALPEDAVEFQISMTDERRFQRPLEQGKINTEFVNCS